MNKLSDQEAFNIMVRHLQRQAGKSLTKNGTCAYRGVKGRMCAVGALIPNSMYDAEMEMSITYLFNDFDRGSFPKLKAFFSELTPQLLDDMQKLHDGASVCEWKRGFRVIADRYNLSIPK